MKVLLLMTFSIDIATTATWIFTDATRPDHYADPPLSPPFSV